MKWPHRAATACGSFACAIGGIALLGWITGNGALQSVFAGSITIKANTAIALILTGGTLVLLAPERPGRARRLAGRLLALVPIALGLATLAEHLSGWNLGIDQLIFPEAPGAAATVSPNRMGLPASVCFPLLGIGLLLLGRESGRKRSPSQVLALTAMFIAAIPALGYVFGVHELFGIARYTGIALHTTSAFLLLGLGTLLARPSVGLMRHVTAKDEGGLLLRRLLPAAILLPVVLGWLLAAGQDAGFYRTEFGRSLLVLGFILVFSGLVWWMAGVLSRAVPVDGATTVGTPEAETFPARLQNLALVGGLVTVAVLIAGAAIGWISAVRLIENDRRLALAHSVMTGTEVLMSTIKDAETGQRGYLLTNDPAYLGPYRAALQRLDGTFTQLRVLTTDEPDQQIRLAHIAPLLVLKSRELERTVALMRQGDRAGALAVVGSDQGRQIMDRIRLEVAAMQQQARANLAQKSIESRTSSRAMLYSIVLSALIGVGLVALAFRLNHRALRERTQLVHAARELAARALARAQAEAALRESETVFRTMGEAVPDLLWMADADGRPLHQNPAWQAYLGTSAAELGERGWTPMIHPEDLPALQRQWSEVLARPGPFSIEARMRRHDGVYHWFSGRAVPVHDEAGRVTKWVGTLTDVHDLKTAQTALTEEARRKDEFLAILAHELRNPLAPVRNSVSLLKLLPSLPADVRQPIDMIDRQVSQMARLIDDLLDVSRITHGVVELQMERLEFSEVVHAVVETFEGAIVARGQRLVVTLPEGPLLVRGDRHRLLQVFGNLISNASKYTNPGGTIDFSVRRHDDTLEALVSDDGIGIPHEMLSAIFDLFVQVDRSRERHGGLGIGLTLARQLVEMHRGTIQACSDGVGRGSTFVVRLPLTTESADGNLVPAAAERGREPRRVLVVDDNEDSAESLALLLGVQGHTVRVETDSRNALEAVADFAPDVAILDVGMPHVDGYELARRIRRQPWGASVCLVALTGWGTEKDRRRSQDAGFDHHLVKPATPESLEEICIAAPRRVAASAPATPPPAGTPDPRG